MANKKLNNGLLRKICVGWVLATLSCGYAAAATIVFSTTPMQSTAGITKLYTPLIDYLSKVTGQQFVIKPAVNIIEYENKMRNGKYSMLLDGPQFTAWRMKHMGFIPVARLSGDITDVVAVSKGAKIRAIGDLVGRKVCAFAPPNMLTLDFMQRFPDPAQQPVFLRKQSCNALLVCVQKGEADAAVLRKTVWDKQPHKGLRLLQLHFRSHPELTFSLSPHISAAIRVKIAAALLRPAAEKAASPILSMLNKRKIIAADPKAYIGLDKLLEPVWGFQ